MADSVTAACVEVNLAMREPVELTRLIIARLCLQPWTWLWVLGLIAWQSVMARVRHLGIATSDLDDLTLLGEAMFVASLIGAIASIGPLSRFEGLLCRMKPPLRLACELLPILTCQALFTVVLFVRAAFGLIAEPAAVAFEFAACTGLQMLHVAMLTLLCLRLPGTEFTRRAALVVVSWMVPSLVVSAGHLGTVAGALCPSRYQQLLAHPAAEFSGVAGGLAAVLGLGIAAALSSSPFTRSR